jgi:fructokinase
MNSPRRVIVGLGEILWDVFPDGPRFGGAPANFTCSAASLGKQSIEAWMVSSVGNDDLGERAIATLQQHGINTSCVEVQSRPTGKVLVELDADGCASYQFGTDSAWDYLHWSAALKQLALRTDAVCFGTLGQRCEQSRTSIQKFVAATNHAALRILDINIRRPFLTDQVMIDSLQLANVLKLNEEELAVVATLLGLSGSPVSMLRQLADQFDLQVVALTRGADGAVLLRGNEISEQAGFTTVVVDTVGAGDAFTAVLTLGLLNGVELDAINRNACEVAAFVCSQSGATGIYAQ